LVVFSHNIGKVLTGRLLKNFCAFFLRKKKNVMFAAPAGTPPAAKKQ
jgi:hypothetical protein